MSVRRQTSCKAAGPAGGKGQATWDGSPVKASAAHIGWPVDYMAAHGAHRATPFSVDTGQTRSVHMRNVLVDTSNRQVLETNFF
jgi:hypothetical protein